MRKFGRLLPMAVAPCIMAACATSTSTQMSNASAMAATGGMSDRNVVDVVHTSNMGEAQEGQLATERAVSSQVRTFAQRMIADHVSADQQLLSAQGGSQRWGLTTTGSAGSMMGMSAGTRTGGSGSDGSSGSGSMGASGSIGTTGSAGYAGAGTSGSTGSTANGTSGTTGSNGSMSMSNMPNGGMNGMSMSGGMNGMSMGNMPMSSTPMSSTPMAADLQRNTVQTMNALSSYTGAAFDRAYIDNQVAMHSWVLQSLDNNLIPSARDAQLRSTLQQIRASVAEHLRMAQDIQSSLGR